MLDLLIRGARVLTMDPSRPTASTIGVWRGRIVGLDSDVESLPARRSVDLGGLTVLPGFIDAHVHLAWTGIAARSASIAPCADAATVLRVIADAAAARPRGEWVDVNGYDQRALGRHLTAAELDSVAAGRKLFVVHTSGHACVVNSEVLALLPETVSHSDGVFAESGMAAVRALRLPYSTEELVKAISVAGQQCAAEGVTTAVEAGLGGGLVQHSPVELGAYQSALAQGRLPIRMQLMVAADAMHPVAAHASDGISAALDLGLRTGFGGERLSIGAMKVFTDGAMMPRTAALTSPYVGLNHAGQLYDSPQRLRESIVDGHRAGWQLAVHAIGDRAVDLALDAFSLAQRRFPRNDARHRIEHAGLVRPDQLARFASLDIAAVVQPNFLWYLGDDYAEIMGPDRADWLYRGRGFLEAGARFVASSDRPVTDGAPLRAIQFMVDRLSGSGRRIGATEGIDVLDALRAYTSSAAHACGLERDLGSVAAGKLADFVVLQRNPLEVDSHELARIPVVATVVDGEIVRGAW
jgi:hypothetical protein